MIGFTIMLVIGIFVKGIIPDLYVWLVFLGALIGVPIIYFLTMIFPIVTTQFTTLASASVVN
jgi:hypothetical protein